MTQTVAKVKTATAKKQKYMLLKNLNLSPLDLCLKKSLISKDMHRAANFLIYLYTIRYGNRRIISDYGYSLRSRFYIPNSRKEEKHNMLYKKTAALLIKEQSYNLVRDVCVFSIFPSFLKDANFKINSRKKENIRKEYLLFLQGMETTVKTLSPTLSKRCIT